MPDLVRFSVSMEASLAARFDRMIRRRGYPSRSEAVRDMVRRELVRQEWEDPEAEAVGTVTLVYDHHVRDLSERLTEMQHRQHHLVTSTTHVHLTHDHCLEVIVVRGRARDVQALADKLIAARGVLHGELVATATGKALQGRAAHKHH